MTMHRDASGTDPGSKSAAEIEREVRESRADVERTLDQIQERLSPGQLLDQAVGYFRSGGGEFMRNLGDSVRSNPLPVTLVGVGLAWMMLAGGRNGGRSRAPDWEREDWDDLAYDPYAESEYGADPYAESEYAAGALYEETTIGPAFGSDPTTGRGIGERMSDVGERASEIGERAKDASASAKQRAEALGAAAGERLSEAGDRLRRRAEHTGASARRYGRRAKESAFQALSEHPLVLGAFGLAVGAALGGALPPSETEDRLMGKTGDRLQRRAAEAGREGLAKARAAAGAAYDAARDEAEAQGLTPEAAREAARSTADKVGKVASAARSAAEEEVSPGLGPSDQRPT
jgi:ElaB/YqjD/DUF883 family membrane-anchored ribosome-binding protein